MYKFIPNTTSSQHIQKKYRMFFDSVIKTREPLLVLNNNKPEVVIIDVKTFESMQNMVWEYEQEMARKAIENYQNEKRKGKLKKLNSLADLM